MKPITPTKHPDVNEILDDLLKNVTEILRDQLVGMYLLGSLANGDFDKDSDIDVLIVTKDEVLGDNFSALYKMHEKLLTTESPWAIQMEVSYIPQDALHRYDPSNNKHPHIDRGYGEKLHIMQHDTDWITQRYIMRERGITIVGPTPRSLIDPVSPDDLKCAVVDILNGWMKSFLDDPDQLKSRGYQSYAVLTLCRILHTFKYGTIVSKPVAAEWAKENLDIQWKPLIEQAWIDRQNPSDPTDSEDIKETQEMIKYALNLTQPTPYSDVNEVLNLLHANAKEILSDQFVGMYLYGSLSSGDFNPASSDIDFLFITKNALPEDTISRLDTMHQQTWATSLKRAGKLEGAYVPKELIRKHDPTGKPCPTVNEGKFYIAPLGSDWIIQRHVIREYGVVIEGPDPKTLIDFVTSVDIRNSVMGVLQDWWFPMLDNPSWLREHDAGYRSFAVITMCRVIHALETGTIISKPKAVQFARAKLDTRWQSLIDKAVAVSNHADLDIPLDETLKFIQFIKEKIS